MATQLTQAQKARLIDEYIYKREQLLQAKVDKMAISLFDKVFTEYLSQLEQSNGKITNSKKNISAVNGLDQIYKNFNKSENIPTLKAFTNDALALTPLNEDYFKNITPKPTEQAAINAAKAVNNGLGITDTGSIVKGGFMEKVIKDDQVLQAIKKTTLQAITKQQGFLQFKNEMKKTITGEDGVPLSGKLQQYYRNYAYDTMMQVDRVNSDTFASNLGLIYFYWSGGIIKTSRALCKLCNGKIVNTLQLSKLTFETLRPDLRGGITKEWVPVRDLGMWGCRHRKNFVSDEEAAKHRDKWLNINTISTKPIAERNTRILTKEQQQEFNKFPRTNTGSAAEDALQEASIKTFITNKRALAQEYIQRFGNTINTDDARKLFTAEGYSGLNSQAVHEASSAVGKEALKYLMKTSNSDTLEMFAGGAGSGKTSAIQGLKPDLKDSAVAVIDGTMAGYEGSVSKLNQFVSAGKNVNISYAYRDPLDAWENGVVSRMLNNKEEMGRTVSISAFLDNTEGSYNTVSRMLNEGFDKKQGVNISLVDNSLGKGNTDYMTREKFNSISYPPDLRAKLLVITKRLYDSGKITKDQYNALIQ